MCSSLYVKGTWEQMSVILWTDPSQSALADIVELLQTLAWVFTDWQKQKMILSDVVILGKLMIHISASPPLVLVLTLPPQPYFTFDLLFFWFTHLSQIHFYLPSGNIPENTHRNKSITVCLQFSECFFSICTPIWIEWRKKYWVRNQLLSNGSTQGETSMYLFPHP